MHIRQVVIAAHAALPRVHHIGFEEIGDIILTAPAASIEFAGIAAGYAAFLLIWNDVYGDNAGDQILQLTFNSDSGANYDYSQLGFGTATSTTNAANYIRLPSCGFVGDGQLHVNGKLLIFNRASQEKIAFGASVSVQKGGAGIENLTGYHIEAKWRNVADEISTVTITPSVGNFVAGSRVILLGVKT